MQWLGNVQSQQGQDSQSELVRSLQGLAQSASSQETQGQLLREMDFTVLTGNSQTSAGKTLVLGNSPAFGILVVPAFVNKVVVSS